MKKFWYIILGLGILYLFSIPSQLSDIASSGGNDATNAGGYYSILFITLIFVVLPILRLRELKKKVEQSSKNNAHET